MRTTKPLMFITTIAIVIVFIPSIVFAQVLEQVDSLVVVDKNQKRVGKVIDNGRVGIPQVAFKFGDNVFVLKTLKMSFVGGGLGEEGSHGAVYFEDFGCTGEAFIEPAQQPHGLPESARIVPQAAVGQDGGTVYFEDVDGELKTDFQALSILRAQSNVVTCEDQGGPTGTNPVRPTIKLVNMFDYFMPPFSLQAEAGQDITALQQKFDALSDDFTGHTHTYQTGKTKNHNRVTATTGPAMPAAP